MIKIINTTRLGTFEVTFLSKTRIRSRYQRQILAWLNDDSGSVSEISKSLDIRTPHASLALSELRKKGFVHRDDTYGIRGALHSITESGRAILEENRLSLFRKYAANIDQDFDGVLLESNGNELLLCYHKKPPNSLVALPLDPFNDNIEKDQDSTGTEGVIWASVVPGSITWYSAHNLQQISPPNELGINTLDAWLQTTDTFALVRVKLFAPLIQWNIPPGTNFRTPEIYAVSSPKIISSGKYTIGNVPDTNIEVTWGNRLHAHLSSEIDVNLMINSFSEDAFVLRKNPVKPDIPTLPIDSILAWLRRRHNRMSEEKLLGKYQQIKSSIMEKPAKTISTSLQKELSRDFGYCNWVINPPKNIEISNVSTNGLISIITYLRDSYTEDYVIEWDWDIDRGYEFLDNLLRDARCRLIVTKTGPAKNIESSHAMLKSLPSLAMAQLILPNQHFVEVELSSSSGHNSNVSHSIIPSDATELINSYDNGSWDLTKMSGNSDNFEFKSDIWQSLTKYPEGDEEWSNSIELVNPLAAWIATPARNRPSRWVRISSKLTGNWVDLMHCEVTPPKLLLGGLGSASEDWKMKAIKLLAQHFLDDNQHLIEAKKGVQSSHELSALSTAVLLICDKLSDEFTQYVREAVDEWLDTPLFADDVLKALFKQVRNVGYDRFGVFEKVVLASEIHPKDSILYNWGKYVQSLTNSEIISNEQSRGYMSTLPYEWWYANASDWLVGQLSSSVGRRWLGNQMIPWPALLYRLEGEQSGPPGFVTKYVKQNLSSTDLLFIPIMQDCPAKDFLMDTYDLVSHQEDKNHRVTARTHPKLSYLITELSEWPDFNYSVINEGDSTIGSLIFGISYHKNLA